MTSQRMIFFAAVGLALAVTLGSMQTAPAQIGIGGGGFGPVPDPSQITSVGTNKLIAVETPAKDGVKVYSIDEGIWTEYRAPKGIRTRPCGAVDYVATMPEGPKITQLAAFSDPSKGWITLDLPEPAPGKLWGPVLGPTIAVYVDGRHVYAFSSLASKWGVLELPPKGAKPNPIIGSRVATVTHGDRIYIFNGKFGRWDDSGDKPK